MKRNSSKKRNFQLTILKRKQKRPIKISDCLNSSSIVTCTKSWLERNKIGGNITVAFVRILYLQFSKNKYSLRHVALVLYFPGSFRFRFDRRRKRNSNRFLILLSRSLHAARQFQQAASSFPCIFRRQQRSRIKSNETMRGIWRNLYKIMSTGTARFALIAAIQ